MQIIPALYIKKGRFALYQPGKRKYAECLPQDPYELISTLGSLQFPRIHIIDQDSWSGLPSRNNGLLGSLAKITPVKLEVGGGLRNLECLHALRQLGIQYYVIGALQKPEFLREISKDNHIHNRQILLSIDVKNNELEAGRKTWSGSVTQLVQNCFHLGFRRFIINDLDTHQIEKGPSLSLYRRLIQRFPEASFLASGRIITFEHLESLRQTGVSEALLGNEIYTQKDLLEQLSAINASYRVGVA